jgi:hypothetical protein
MLDFNFNLRLQIAVETVGAVYVVSAGVPEPRTDHCKALTLLALDLHHKLDEAFAQRPAGAYTRQLSEPFSTYSETHTTGQRNPTKCAHVE